MGDEQFCFVEGCQRSWGELPARDGPLTVGIDGGYVHGRHKQKQFEVIAGKSILAFKRNQEGKRELSGRCFAWVQTYDEKPKRRLFELLKSQGMQLNQQVDFLSDGGEAPCLIISRRSLGASRLQAIICELVPCRRSGPR